MLVSINLWVSRIIFMWGQRAIVSNIRVYCSLTLFSRSRNYGVDLMNSHSKNNSVVEKKNSVSGKRLARLFVTYWALAFMIVVMGLYPIAELVTLNLAFILFVAITVVAAVVTLIHVRKGKNTNIDELAKKM